MMVLFGWVEILRTGKPICKFCGLMDQDGQMLGADVNILTPITHLKQGDFFLTALAIQTNIFRTCHAVASNWNSE